MIKEKIEISLYNSYDCIAWEKALIEKCIFDNPSSTFDEIGPLLNMSARTLFRKVREHKINVDLKRAHGKEFCYSYETKNKA